MHCDICPTVNMCDELLRAEIYVLTFLTVALLQVSQAASYVNRQVLPQSCHVREMANNKTAKILYHQITIIQLNLQSVGQSVILAEVCTCWGSRCIDCMQYGQYKGVSAKYATEQNQYNIYLCVCIEPETAVPNMQGNMHLLAVILKLICNRAACSSLPAGWFGIIQQLSNHP